MRVLWEQVHPLAFIQALRHIDHNHLLLWTIVISPEVKLLANIMYIHHAAVVLAFDGLELDLSVKLVINSWRVQVSNHDKAKVVITVTSFVDDEVLPIVCHCREIDIIWLGWVLVDQYVFILLGADSVIVYFLGAVTVCFGPCIWVLGL